MCKIVIKTCLYCGVGSEKYSFCRIRQEGKMCVNIHNSSAKYSIMQPSGSVVETRPLKMPVFSTRDECSYFIDIQDLLDAVRVDDLCAGCALISTTSLVAEAETNTRP